jgi:serine/threonine protein phosphatase 1
MRDSDFEGRRVFAVGDVHGCHGKLTTLLKRLPFDPEGDALVFLGDYINRGPRTREVIERLLELRATVRSTVFLIGNHEHELLSYVRTGDPEGLRALRRMGVEATLASYDENSVRALRSLSFMPREHRAFLEGLQPCFRWGSYLFTHAGVVPGEAPESCALDRLLNVRDVFLEHPEPLGFTVVFGHTPFETPFLAVDRIGIDTGAVYGNTLTAVELPRMRFYHA